MSRRTTKSMGLLPIEKLTLTEPVDDMTYDAWETNLMSYARSRAISHVFSAPKSKKGRKTSPARSITKEDRKNANLLLTSFAGEGLMEHLRATLTTEEQPSLREIPMHLIIKSLREQFCPMSVQQLEALETKALVKLLTGKAPKAQQARSSFFGPPRPKKQASPTAIAQAKVANMTPEARMSLISAENEMRRARAQADGKMTYTMMSGQEAAVFEQDPELDPEEEAEGE